MPEPINLNVPPYYDDFDPSKQYVQLLAVPGRVEQSRDFTQLQTLFRYLLKNFSDAFMKNGDIVSGMNFHWNGNQLTVDDGKVYLDGIVQDFKSQTITLTKSGEERVGVKTEATLITESDDSSLYDPAVGQRNYGQPGTHRLKFYPKLAVNDSTASTIYRFQNGDLFRQVTKPENSVLNDILAKRTADESGNYRVNGLELKVDEYDANNVQVTVEAGTAYVQGYQVIKPYPFKKTLPISNSYQTRLAEPKTYEEGTNEYLLNNYPARQINKVTAVVRRTRTVTRGANANGIDYLPDTSVVAIQSIEGYTKGTDYKLTEDGVDWSPAGAEPAAGESYNVTYDFNKTMVKDTDYEMASITDDWGSTKDYIRFLSGDLPVANSQFNIDYDFYLARIDAIGLDKEGNIVVLQGTPAIERLVHPPNMDITTYLPLGNVYLPPNSLNGQPKFNTITRLTMDDLQKMMKRLEIVEYNQAIAESDREAMAGENPSDLMGVFSDNFRSISKGDVHHPDFSVMYSLEDGHIMLPIENESEITPDLDLDSSDAHVFSTLISSPLEEYVAINQPHATTTMLVNPHLAFNTLSSITLNPSVDNWVDTSTINIENTDYQTRNLYLWWRHNNDAELKAHNDAVFAALDPNLRTENGTPVSQYRPRWNRDSTTATSTSYSQNVVENAETYMRQREITVTGHNFQPNADNLTLYFDGVRCELTPATGYSAGSNAGTIRANGSGDVKATFTNPSGIRTGIRQVVLKNDDNVANTTYRANGTKRRVTNTVLKTVYTLRGVDPLAQSFQFDSDTVVTSLGLYFSSKGSSDNVIVQIRNITESGFPGSECYGECTLYPSDIRVSEDSSIETKVTFDDPVYCKANTQYCIVVQAGTDEPGLFICDLGHNDLLTNELISSQAYLVGVLFSSSNNTTWTPEQEKEMKFKVYAARFNDTGTVQFQPMTDISADRIVMLADYLTPQNTGCVWEAQINGGAWQSISAYEEMDLRFVANTLTLRATFKANQDISPLLTKESFTLMGFLTAQNGVYVGRNVELDYDYTTVRESIVANIPQGCTVTPKFSYDNGKTWITPTLSSSGSVSANEIQYNYEATVDETVHAQNFRARIEISANTPFLRPFVSKLYCVMK